MCQGVVRLVGSFGTRSHYLLALYGSWDQMSEAEFNEESAVHEDATRKMRK